MSEKAQDSRVPPGSPGSTVSPGSPGSLGYPEDGWTLNQWLGHTNDLMRQASNTVAQMMLCHAQGNLGWAQAHAANLSLLSGALYDAFKNVDRLRA